MCCDKEDAEDTRMCLACGHAVAHDEGDYEDTHFRCSHVDLIPTGCETHKEYFESCQMSRFRKCYVLKSTCGCTSDTRYIADLKAEIEFLKDQTMDFV